MVKDRQRWPLTTPTSIIIIPVLRSRYRRIIFFFARMLLSLIVWELWLPWLGLRAWSARTRAERLRRAAVSFRVLALHMGGVLIKVGQFLSARVDVLPRAFTDELKDLQDEVPPEAFAAIRRQAEGELGVPLEQIFERFDTQPLAAASLGQVHLARVRPDDLAGLGFADPEQPFNVVVKILRPGIERLIDTDLAALRTVGGWLHRYRPIRKRANVPALLEEFTRTLLAEVDYLAEGKNAEVFAANFSSYPGVRVPAVDWEHTTRRVLTLENVLAIKITDYAAIEAAGLSRSEVAGRLLDTYLKQIFEDGFFHADPHPGNLFVQPVGAPGAVAAPPPWTLTFVDFGMVGTVPENLRQGLRELVIAVGVRDARRVVEAYQHMDLLLPDLDVELLERANARVFERYWGLNMTELTSVSAKEIIDLTEEFRDLFYSLPFQVPQNVIFLGRCVGILSGMCTGLDPNFNLWEHLAPYARKLIAEEARRSRENWLGEVEKLARTALAAPQKVDAILTRLERGDVTVRVPEISRQVQRLESAQRAAARSVVFAALLVSGVQLYLAGEAIFAWTLLAGAGLAFLSLLFGGRQK